MRRSRTTAAGIGACLLAVPLGAGAVPASAAEPTVVLSTDFEDGSWGPWTQNGDASLSVVEVDGDHALLVSGRVNDWDGIKSPGGLLEGGVEYTFSMQARLAEGTAGPADVRFVVEPAYTWVGNTAMSADAWTTVSGTFTAPDDADPATLRAFVGTGVLPGGGSYDYLVDDILITAPPSTPDVETVASLSFDDGTTGDWTVSGGPTLAYVDADGGKALAITRAADYEGIQSPVGILEAGREYSLSMRARLPEGATGEAQVRFVVKPGYDWVGNATVDATGWTTISGTYTLPEEDAPAESQVYIGTSDQSGAYTVLVDDVLITAQTGGEQPWEPQPDPDFVPGGAVNPTATPLAAARGTGDVAALTFDDGPNPGETDQLLDFLAANDITATFCVIGQNIQADGGAELLRRIVDEGHTLCNHSTSYADMGSWTHEQVEADLKENLRIIREALGDPDQEVPYWRAPNGSWGVTGEVAAALGMQPLGLGNIIFDWDGNDLSEETLTANLREAMQPGAVVLVHDGGGNRENSIAAVETVVAEKLAEGWTFTLPQGGIPSDEVVLSTGFEDGLDGWGPRADSEGAPTVEVTTAEAHSGAQAALVSNRTSQGDGIGHEVTGLLTPGVTYEFTAWVKMAEGEDTDSIWLSRQRTNDGADAFDTLGQFDGITSTGWTQVSAEFTAQEADFSLLYLETSYNTGGAGSFLVDDIVLQPQAPGQVQDLTPIQDTVPFPVGVAIDSRETNGAASELVLRHFDQVTPENHMKVEAWYDAEQNFRIHPEAAAIMDFAQANDLRVYGHVLLWHSQTPAWFFQDEAGNALTTSPEDQQILRDRLRQHVFDVAESLRDGWGEFGAENPLVAWDVVNEVISDSGEYEDGMRRSEWYRILGEEYVDLAFAYADEAFNETYAADGADRPVTLFINDYNTEQAGKQQRYRALVDRLLGRGVPLDGVGHQFHVSLSTPVEALEGAIQAFADLPVTQAVTELDVTVGGTVSEARLIDQGYYYRDAFRVFREHAEELFSVTVWGLTDNRSWRSEQAPLIFDAEYQAKPAYYGVVDGDLPARQRTAFVFQGDVPLDGEAVGSPVWQRLPLHQVEELADFQLRWEADHLVAYVRVSDTTSEDTDGLELVVGDATYAFARDGSGDVEGVVEEVEGGWAAVVHLPLDGAAQGDLVDFDLRVTDGGTTVGWNDEGTLGTLTLVEPLSYTEVVQAASAPSIDGVVDDVWSAATTVTTDKQLSGTGDGTAEIRTLWQDGTLYVLAEVSDDQLDASGSDPWTQDSVEIFVDAGNLKNGPYRYDDTQIRISYENVLSFGTGDETFQRNRVQSATQVVDGGYVVEAAVSLLEHGGLGTFHGLDFQVNDAEGGVRTSIRTWADPTGLGYQSTSRWGVARLVGAEEPPAEDADLSVDVTGPRQVQAGRYVTYTLTVTNEGPATSEQVRAALGATDLTNIRASAGATRGTVRFGEATITGAWWAVPALEAGESVEMTITGRASTNRPGMTAVGGARSQTEDPDTGNNVDRQWTRVVR